MKKILSITCILLTTATLAILSCRKSAVTSSGQSLKELFSDLSSTPQTLWVYAGRDTIVQGKDRTILHFYPNSFRNASGNIITSGKIYIELVEMTRLGKMVANRASTTCGNKLLQSGGQISISATMNGEKVFANVYGIAFKQPQASSVGMQLFYANPSATDSSVNWAIADTTQPGTIATRTVADTAVAGSYQTGLGFASGYYYLFDSSKSFDLVNCDRIYDYNEPNTTISVQVPNSTFNPANTLIFLVFPDIHSLTMSDYNQQYDAATNTFIPGNHMNEFPVGAHCTVIVLSNVNGVIYYAEQSITVAVGVKATANLAPMAKNDIMTHLAGIF